MRNQLQSYCLGIKPKQFIGISLFFCLCFGACSQSNHNSTDLKSTDSTTLIPQTTRTAIPNVDSGLMMLKTFKDQYPSDVKLLDQPELKIRLEQLLGSEYGQFRKYWQTETPIIIEDNVLSTTGCEQHNCAANEYVLQIDLLHNNINIYHFGQSIQSYLEKGPISLPPGLAKDFQTISSNIK